MCSSGLCLLAVGFGTVMFVVITDTCGLYSTFITSIPFIPKPFYLIASTLLIKVFYFELYKLFTSSFPI